MQKGERACKKLICEARLPLTEKMGGAHWLTAWVSDGTGKRKDADEG
jgi:hypothetical protein